MTRLSRLIHLAVAVLMLAGGLASGGQPAAAQPNTQNLPNIYVTAQRFEHGLMIWRSDTGAIWALFDSGQARRFSVAQYSPLPDNRLTTPPAGLVRPIMGFGKVWGTFPDVRNGLGWAVRSELGYTTPLQTALHATYLRELDGRWIELLDNSTWRHIAAPPAPAAPEVVTFNAQPNPALPGSEIVLAWEVAGVDRVQIGLYNSAVSEQETFQWVDDQPAAGAILATLPTDMPQGVRAVLGGLQRQPDGSLLRVVEATLTINPDSRPPFMKTTRATYQPYQNGFMIWRGDTGGITVFWEGTGGGQWRTYASTTYGNLPNNPIGAVPAGFVRPIMGFGKVWGNYAAIRDSLGYAIGSEQSYDLELTIQGNTYVASTFSLPDGRVIQAQPGGSWTF